MKSFLLKTEVFFNRLFKKESLSSPLSSIISAIFGLLFGFILLIIFNPSQALPGFLSLLTAGLQNVNRLLYGSSILVMTGLSLGIAFKCGLFNIGCSGQFTFGALFALLAAHNLDMPWYVCLIFGVFGGALIATVVGLLKSFFNVNEVISSIMLNYIALFITNTVFSNIFDLSKPNSMGSTPTLSTDHAGSILPHLDYRGYLSISILIAVICVFIFYIIIQKTTTGYELKGVGFNRNAAKYAGINNKKNIILAMAIAGGIAGLAGACQYTSGVFQYKVVNVVLADGFNGISVAFLANCHPIGILFSAVFIYYVTMATASLQVYGYSTEIVNIIVGSIIYLSAFSLIIKKIIDSRSYRTIIQTSVLDKKFRLLLLFKGKYHYNEQELLKRNESEKIDKYELKEAKELDKFYQKSRLMFAASEYLCGKETLEDSILHQIENNKISSINSRFYLANLENELKKNKKCKVEIKYLYLPEETKKTLQDKEYSCDDEKIFKEFVSKTIKKISDFEKKQKNDLLKKKTEVNLASKLEYKKTIKTKFVEFSKEAN